MQAAATAYFIFEECFAAHHCIGNDITGQLQVLVKPFPKEVLASRLRAALHVAPLISATRCGQDQLAPEGNPFRFSHTNEH